MTFKLRYDGKTFPLSTIPTTKISDFMNEIKLLTDVYPSRQQISYGFPPKQIPTDSSSLELTLEEIGIKGREMFTLIKRSNDVEFKEEKSSILSCEKRNIPGDNSCLFNSISFLCAGKDNAAYELRQVCINAIKADPVKYNEAMLDMPPDSYCRYIADPKNWGGYIEIGILSSHFNVEICVLHIEEGNVVKVNPCNATKRIFILYDNIHYDAIVFKAFGDPPERRIVPCTDARAYELATELMGIARAAGGFTNINKSHLQCEECGLILKGKKDAELHLKRTGHTHFAQPY